MNNSPFSQTIEDLMFWADSPAFHDKIEERLKMKLSHIQKVRVSLYGETELEKIIAENLSTKMRGLKSQGK